LHHNLINFYYLKKLKVFLISISIRGMFIILDPNRKHPAWRHKVAVPPSTSGAVG
jgi:hypothetical protein